MPFIKSICLLFRGKNVLGDHIRRKSIHTYIQEVQIDAISCSSLSADALTRSEKATGLARHCLPLVKLCRLRITSVFHILQHNVQKNLFHDPTGQWGEADWWVAPSCCKETCSWTQQLTRTETCKCMQWDWRREDKRHYPGAVKSTAVCRSTLFCTTEWKELKIWTVLFCEEVFFRTQLRQVQKKKKSKKNQQSLSIRYAPVPAKWMQANHHKVME